MTEEHALIVKGLEKDFGDIHAVRGIDFSIPKGEIFSLLGPNGAGKSTVISMISGLLEPTAGDALILGHSITRAAMPAKTALGVVPQDLALYEDLSARENLAFWGKMYGLRGRKLQLRMDAVLEIIGLAQRQKGRVEKFSGGMKRRLNIGVALLHEPQILILDEPTVGIDPQSRRKILDSLKDLNARGTTILYTTHYMEEAQELSNQIAIMDNGEIIAAGTHAELTRIVGEYDRVELTLDGSSELVRESWMSVTGIHGISAENGLLTLLVNDSNTVLPRLFESATDVGVRITSVEIYEPNLETVFLHLTGRALRDQE